MYTRNRNTFIALVAALVLALSAVGCTGGQSANDSSPVTASVSETTVSSSAAVDAADSDAGWDEQSATKISLDGTAITVDGDGAKATGSVVTISAGGTYVVSGTLTDGQIVVTAPQTTAVQLVMNGADITSGTSAPIYCSQADKLTVTLADGTANAIADGASFAYSNTTDEEPDAALFSKCDLTINGGGSLTVSAGFNNGIGSKDDLLVTGGDLTITATNHGLRGRDSVTVTGGSITVTAGNDGIQSNNDEDASKGWISLEGGTFDITADHDGIQAETSLTIAGGDYTIATGGGTEKTTGNTTVDSDSYKGLKATGNLTVNGGSFNIDSADDTIHSNADVAIGSGIFALSSGDDGIHADGDLSVSGGDINISQSYEGLEAATMTIAAGTISLVAKDDGVNVAGGNDGGAGGFGQDSFSSDSQWLHITGGTITVDATGDGIDVNGDAEISGGEVYVNGPTGSGNGTLDYDGTFNISGGILVAAGSSGMAQSPSSSSSQPSLMLYYTAAQAGGTSVELSSPDGTELIRFTHTKEYACILLSSPALQEGGAYTVSSAGTKVVEATLAAAVTSISDTGEAVSAGMGGRGGGQMGGPRPGGGGPGGAPPDRSQP